jgi:hypothetical protein
MSGRRDESLVHDDIVDAVSRLIDLEIRDTVRSEFDVR